MQYKNVLEKMQIKKGQGQDLLTLKRFLDVEREKVGVCIHPSTEIGSYHTHDFFEVNYVFAGRCVNLVEEKYLNMEKGDLILLHPGTFHTLYAEENCKVYNFLIEEEWFIEKARAVSDKKGEFGKFLERAGKEDFFKFLLIRKDCGNPALSLKAEKITGTNESDTSIKNFLTEAAFLEFFAEAAKGNAVGELSEGRGESSYKTITLLTYLMHNYATVTLEKLSEKFFYSKTHICRLFIKNTGKTFNQTLTDVRLANAQSLLKNTDLTVSEIAKKVGYESNEYFQRMFKKKVGISPGSYRKT